jgi:hypothetical protein
MSFKGPFLMFLQKTLIFKMLKIHNAHRSYHGGYAESDVLKNREKNVDSDLCGDFFAVCDQIR